MHGLPLIGYTAVSVVFLAELGYLARVITRDAEGGLPQAWPFVLLNLAGWALGAFVGRRHATLGRSLVLLGDALVPLNVFWAFLVLRPATTPGDHATSLVVAGMAHLGVTLYRIATGLAKDGLYAYFSAGWGGLLLCLARYAMELDPATLLWLALGYGFVLRVRALRLDAEEGAPVALAATGLVAAVLVVVCALYGRAPSARLLGALYTSSAVLLVWALFSRQLGPAAKWSGLAAYGSATAALSVTLAYRDAGLATYLAATAAWIAVLTLAGVLLRHERLDPFRESAHWLGAGLGSWLAVATAPLWWMAVGLPAVRWSGMGWTAAWRTAEVARIGALALSVVALAVGALALWRRRHPPIAYTVGGLVVNQVLTLVASYLGPFLLVLGACAAWAAAGGDPAWSPLPPLAVGLALLNLPRAERAYGSAAWSLAGYLALLTSAAMALRAGRATVTFLLLCATVLLVRALRQRAAAPLVAFLIVLVATAIRLSVGPRGPETLGLALLAAGSLLAHRMLLDREPEGVRSGLVLAWSVVSGIWALSLTLARTPDAMAGPLVLWLGIPLALPGRKQRAGQAKYDPGVFVGEWIETLAYLLVHAAGAVVLMLAWRKLGMAPADAGPVLAGWAWAHLGLHRWLRDRAPERPVTAATALAAQSLAVFSLVLPAFSTSRRVAVATLLIDAALFFFWSDTVGSARSTRRLGLIGHVLSALAIAVAAFAGAALAAQALVGGAFVYWWRAGRAREMRAQLASLAAATAAAVVAMAAEPGRSSLLPLSLASVAMLVAGVLTQRVEGRSDRVRVTWFWALVVGLAASVGELWRSEASPFHGEASPYVFIPLWLGFLLGARIWDARGHGDAVRPGEPEDAWLALGSHWLAHLAGGASVVAAALESNLGAGGAAAGLSLWACVHWLVARVSASSGALAAHRALGHAVRAFAAGSLLLAAFSWSAPRFGILACALTGLLYVALLPARRARWLLLVPALAFVEGLWLLGAATGVDVPEYYLTAASACLYLALRLREDPKPATAPGSWLLGGPRGWLLRVRDALLPTAIVILTVGYPFWAILRGHGTIHLFYLGGATALMLFAFWRARQSPVYVYVFCALLLGGVLYLFAARGLDEAGSLFLLAAGPLVLLNLLAGSAGSRPTPPRTGPARSGPDRVPA